MLGAPPSSAEEALAEAGPNGDLLPSHGWVAMAKSWETFPIAVFLTCLPVERWAGT